MFFRNPLNSPFSRPNSSLKLNGLFVLSVSVLGMLSNVTVSAGESGVESKTTCTDATNPNCLCRPEILGFPNNIVKGQTGNVLPIVLEADSVEAVSDKQVTLKGAAFVAQGRQSIGADSISYDRENDKLKANGGVEVRSIAGDVIKAEYLDLDITSAIGDAQNAEFKLAERGVIEENTNAVLVQARGKASHMSFEGKDFVSLENVQYTNCVEGQDDFYIKAKELELDHATGIGSATNASFVFKGVPVFYLPHVSFPITDQRKSGFLFPVVGNDSKSGFVFGVPWYWNISPNMDATITPKIFTKRGAQVGLEARHITENSTTELNAEVLPSDKKYDDETRSIVSFDHTQVFSKELVAKIDFNQVSDVDYFRDFRSDFDSFSTTYTPSEARIDYVQKNWSLGARAVSYEVVDPDSGSSNKPLDILPQITFKNKYKDVADLGLTFQSNLDSSTFKREGENTVTRLSFIPSIEKNYQETWGYVKPKLALNYASYSEDEYDSRSVPIFSVDSGLYFEKRTEFLGEKSLQTLEPRAYFVAANSDGVNAETLDGSSLAFNNFSDLYSETGVTGGDGVEDGQRMTLALASRIYDKLGDQKLKAQIGQTFYLSNDSANESDTLLETTYQPTKELSVGAFLGYSQDLGEFRNTNVNFAYESDEDKYVKLAYRLSKNDQGSTMLSEQSQFVAQAAWPLSPRWKGFMTQRYDLEASENIQTQLGAEYDACCWKLKLTADKLRLASDDYRNAVYAEISFSSLGSVRTSF